jgi:glutathione S-transferase
MITIHHLNFSRSSRVLWLLEELGLTYNLVRYQRDERLRAPPALKQVHPLGKAPVIEDGSLVLAESAVILEYINKRHGAGRFAPPSGSDARPLHDEWLHYVESSAALPVMVTVIGAMTGGLSEGLAGFSKPALANTLDYITRGVQSGANLMGEQFTIADIQLSYMLEIANRWGMLGGYQPLSGYLDRLRARPGFIKAVEVGGPMVPPS